MGFQEIVGQSRGQYPAVGYPPTVFTGVHPLVRLLFGATKLTQGSVPYPNSFFTSSRTVAEFACGSIRPSPEASSRISQIRSARTIPSASVLISP